MKSTRNRTWLIIATASATLASCGGEDGKSSTVQNRAPVFISSATVVVEDDTSGVVYTASATDPDLDRLSYNIVGGDDAADFRITSDGKLSFYEPANFEAPADQNSDNVYDLVLQASDGAAGTLLRLSVSVQDSLVPTESIPSWVSLGSAPWQGRDSAGEATFNGRSWLLGGWVSSFEPALRDVWSTTDGIAWRRDVVEAPWSHSDLSMTVAFAGRLWIMGGYDKGRLADATASNEVWSSQDGVQWTSEGVAPWSARLGSGITIHNGEMWLLGGVERYFDGTDQSLKNDVWASSDGKNWRLVTGNAPWSPRAYHNVLTFGGRIYVFGGGNYAPAFAQTNDVWSSADGLTWRRETALAEWAPRIWASAVAYGDRMWLLGGYSRSQPGNPESGVNLNDVWTSVDGARWTRMQSAETWSPRHEMSVWVNNDRIYLGGGFDGNALRSDVWSLSAR